MRVWRLADARYARDLSGEGSRIAGGRWNAPGHAVLYTSSHLSLALLETLAHLPAVLRDALPPRMAVEIEWPDDLPMRTIDVLPRKLSGDRLLSWCRAAGARWLAAEKEAVLRVPSILVPQEWNYVVNVAARDMRRVRIVGAKPFAIDGRLLR